MCAIYWGGGGGSAFGGYQHIGGIPLVHLWGGVKCIVGIFECIGDIISALGCCTTIVTFPHALHTCH